MRKSKPISCGTRFRFVCGHGEREFAGHLYTHQWQEPNVSFLRQALTPQAVLDLLRRAVALLHGQLEGTVAAQVLKDAPARETVLSSRCAELPRILERTQDPGDQMEWTH
jgi:hypothetical protein